jgi:transcriptional regulator with XRE-family HTH domain
MRQPSEMRDTAHASTLGELVRRSRRQRGWTLQQMSERVGIPLSTLAKIETGKLSLSYERLLQFSTRLGLTLAEFVTQEAAPRASRPRIFARRSVADARNSEVVSTCDYDYTYLCADLRDKHMMPVLARIRAHSFERLGELVQHQGEEFIFVLEGTIELHLQCYAPLVLREGQAVYFDSSMAHALLAKECDSALVLSVCSRDEPDIARISGRS